MTIVIPRSTWAPRYDNGVAIIGVTEWLNAGKELWLHHSITNPFGPDASLAQDCQHMRDFEAIGESRFGAGISYTWVVMPSGRVFQGHDVDRQGTHTYQRNNRSRGICLAGNYDVTGLPGRMERAVSALLRELGATLDGGHRDVYPTACPGRYAYDRIGEINRLASSGEPLDPGGDDMLNAEQITVTNAPWKDYTEMADKALGSVTGRTASIETKLDGLIAQGVPVSVDYDVLADKVAARIGESVAAKVADVIAKRMES